MLFIKTADTKKQTKKDKQKMDSSRGTTKNINDSNMPQDPENWEQQENIKKTISSRKRPNVDATRAAGSPGKSAAMIQQASRNSAASTRNKETAKNQQAAEKAPVAGMAILSHRQGSSRRLYPRAGQF